MLLYLPKIFFVISSIGLCWGYGSHSARSRTPYKVPNAVIEALSPQGLRVSIANDEGVELFGFHGNVNRAIDGIETGQVSGDVIMPTDEGRWEFEDNDISLKVGDVINYWMFVQRRGLGYRKDGLRFTVRELIPTMNVTEITEDEETNSTTCDTEEMNDLQSRYNQTLILLNNLNDKVDPLIEEVGVLREIINEMSANISLGTKLMMRSTIPAVTGSTPLESVRAVVTQKLRLPNYYSKIVSAAQSTTLNEIVFECATVYDKRLILLRSRELLKATRFRIDDFIETSGGLKTSSRRMNRGPLSDDEIAKTIDVRMSRDDDVLLSN